MVNFLLFENVGDNIIGTIVVAIRSLCFSISTFLYQLMINLYNIFDLLCTSRLLDNEVLSAISSRIGLILGIVMFFNIAINFIKMLIDPELISSKDSGVLSIIKKTLIVIVMFGTFNFVFDFLYQTQKFIVENHVVSNFILPYQIESDDVDSFGTTLAYQLMFSFYSNNTFDNVDLSNKEKKLVDDCQSLTNAFRNQVVADGNFELGYACLDKAVSIENYYNDKENDVFIINYNYIFSVAVGAFVVYILLMYCFKVGIRMIQLMVLEILAPVAILSYLSPKKETMFSKWLKIYSATYIDVFIRIGIINFVIFLLATIFQVEKNMDFGFWGTIGDVEVGTKAIIEVIMILALLTFAKKAPDLIKELFPAGASKLGFGLSMKDVVGLQRGFKTATGILGGALGGAAIGLIGGAGIGGKFGGLTGGLLKGGFSGLKGQGLTKTATSAWKNQAKANLSYANAKANGANWFGYQTAHLQQGLNMRTAADSYNQEKAELEADSALYNQFAGFFDKGKGRAKEKIETGDFELATFANNQHAYNAALDVFKQKQRIDLLKASAAKADNVVRDSNGFTELDRLNEQISNEMIVYNKNLDNAIYSYMDHNSNMETAKDKVIAQQFSGAHQLQSSNSKLLGEMDITTAEEFKKSGDKSKGKISEIDEKLIKNKSEGERARANAGK